MNEIKAALRIAPACALSLALLAFASPASADHSGHTKTEDHSQGHDHSATESADHTGHSADHSAAKTDDHSNHSADQTTQAEGHEAHAAGHGDHAADSHRMPDHLGMDDQNTLGIAMSPDGFQYKRSLQDYPVPDVTLRNQFAQKVSFVDVMDFDGPVLLNFIFTSCATICPVMSATFGQTQEDLVAIDENYRMVSISIDPEYDTPARLREYAELHGARDNWVMLTGQFDDIFTVVRAFDAIYKGDNKMYHRPLTFLRANKDAPWLRLEGLLGSEELAEEYSKMLHPEVN
ncbi:MAG: SCO family protein [Roseovarius sp.]|uniref:SCO family protein n=1 Tax=Roseovarius sp. TaxID=1486281 RepID=UPI001B4B3A13|nr:SCO family protein [Roseovarius sp.]MBQ0751811.1 SCO family protein [Roseovarius sp.]MBQ0812373.1 SCO family protein [Roseovarius sp.]